MYSLWIEMRSRSQQLQKWIDIKLDSILLFSKQSRSLESKDNISRLSFVQIWLSSFYFSSSKFSFPSQFFFLFCNHYFLVSSILSSPVFLFFFYSFDPIFFYFCFFSSPACSFVFDSFSSICCLFLSNTSSFACVTLILHSLLVSYFFYLTFFLRLAFHSPLSFPSVRDLRLYNIETAVLDH